MSGTTVPAAIMQLINDHGGIQGIYSSLQQSGLGNVVETWIGTGENREIGAEQLSNALNPQVLEESARRNGIDTGQLVSLAAQYLPMIVDNLTPDGKIPDERSGFLDMAINFLKNRGIS
jgi:uncharacterized protein YidB (DUF937 family)